MRRSLKRSRIMVAAVVVVVLAFAIGGVVVSSNGKTETQEVKTVALTSDIVTAFASSLGSTGGEFAPDPIINPAANLDVRCDGSGEVEFDNRRSTSGMGFELVLGTIVMNYFVEAGEILAFGFSGVPAGGMVVAQTGEGVSYAMMPVPSECVPAP